MQEVVMPDLGPDIEEAMVSFWHVEEGEHVEQGMDIVEVASEKSTFNIQAPCSGVLTERIAREGDTIGVGDVMARIEEDD
ncbi:MAG: hypothetical protein KKH34_10460 [Candidatus Omnitrophica bacterium]|nr:hypothetical protein [Candidatus Omnitrophota bacterium]MCG2703713.1 hypothetical protein [Candidatus Omnitrophota bacterium]